MVVTVEKNTRTTRRLPKTQVAAYELVALNTTSMIGKSLALSPMISSRFVMQKLGHMRQFF